MERAEIISAVLMVLLLGFSALFSGSETAYFSMNHLERDRLRSSGHGRLRKFFEMAISSPADLLVTVLTGNMIVNLFFASLMDRVVAARLGESAWLVSVAAGTTLLLVFGEMLPKNIAIRHPLAFTRVTSRILHAIHVLFSPVRKVLRIVEGAVVAFVSGRVGGGVEDKLTVITSVLRLGLERGIIHESEYSILETFMEYREKTARDIVVPRTDIRGIEASMPLEEALRRPEVSSSRDPIPVYERDLDHIVGYLDVRELLFARIGAPDETTVSKVARAVYTVPPGKNVLKLMQEMIRRDTLLAVVVDEYGGTAGIVTYQLLVEEFLEAYFPSRGARITPVGAGAYRVAGDVELEELEEILGVFFESESRTVAGLITEHTGEIPTPGATVAVHDVTFVVTRVTLNRIVEVQVRSRAAGRESAAESGT